MIDDQGSLKRRKKIKFRAPEHRTRVRLQMPGVNLPTIGALIILAIHGFIEITGGVYSDSGPPRGLYSLLGISGQLLMDGNVWGILTHSLLHGNWFHVILNALVFYYAADRVGHILTPKKIGVLFVCSAGIAALLHSLVQIIFPGTPQGVLVGASGGIMGLFLAQTVLYPDSRMLLLPVSGRNMGKGVLLSSFLLFLMTPGLGLPAFSQIGSFLIILYGEVLFSMGHIYHFAGGLSGLILVERLLPQMVSLVDLKAERERNDKRLEDSKSSAIDAPQAP